MRILLIADLHIGSIKDITYVYNTMVNIIDKEIICTKTDAVIFLGDYFDRLFKVNEDYVSLAINIMSYLIRACAKNKTKIRFIYGTESHEMNQYKLFNYHFSSNKVDIKLIDTVTEEELFPNVNVLYIPEEYINDKHKFYEKYLYSGKHYSYIFGHGIIEDGMPQVVSFSANKNVNEKQVPRFKSGELSEICDFSLWGHYHVRNVMKPNVQYLGSLFRDSFGEEDPKGYGIIEDGEFKFVENTQAYTYKTYEFNPTSDIYNNPDNLISEINRIKSENPDVINGENKGKIRLKFNLPGNVDPSFMENLKTVLVNDKMISPLIKESNNDLIEDIKEDLDEEYDYLLDNSLLFEDKLHRFIVSTYDSEMTIDELKSYINESFK
jgi:hypothetical protein